MTKTLQMNNGLKVPSLAFGMYKIPNETAKSTVMQAIEAGYRHFDTASYYENEEGLGQGLQEMFQTTTKKQPLSREDVFICTKVWNDVQKQGRKAVRKSFFQSLKYLQLDYLDLFLIHWPVPGFHVETYKELELLCQEGKLRSIGISNYSQKDYEELLDAGLSIPPVLNQIEVSPFMYRPQQIHYFQSQNILISAFKAIHRAAPSAMEQSDIVQISQKYNVTPAQLMIRWGLQKEFVVVTKTSSSDRMTENLNVDFGEIEKEDMDILNGITTSEDIRIREERERNTKMSL